MKDINLLFRQAFEYSILELAPKKYGPLVFEVENEFPVKEEDFSKMKEVLVEKMTQNKEELNELLVNSENLSKLNLEILDSLAGKTALHKAGKNLGMLMGKRIQEIDFRKYIFQINLLLENLKVGKIRIKKFTHSAIDLVLLDNIFSNKIKGNKNVCYFMAGFFQGILEDYTNTHWNVIETKCSAKGDEYCEFQARNI